MNYPSDAQMLDAVQRWRGDVFSEGIELTDRCYAQGIRDTQSLAAGLCLDVEYRQCPHLLKFSGLLMLGKDPFIMVNSAHNYLHQQFTIAHEIAHHRLHRNESNPPENRIKIEFQAQALAFMITDTIHPSQMFKILDHNPDLRTPIIYAWMPLDVLNGSSCLRILYEYIRSLES